MFGSWTVYLISSVLIPVVGIPAGDSCWHVDKATVHVGGCVTIVVDKPCNESWNLALQIDDGKPIKLLESVGPFYHRRTSRLPGREENSYVFIGLTHGSPPFADTPLDIRLRTLSHELGHALINQGDTSNTQYVYFPATNTFSDAVVNTYRRIRHNTEMAAGACRPVGNLTAPGNRLISECP